MNSSKRIQVVLVFNYLYNLAVALNVQVMVVITDNGSNMVKAFKQPFANDDYSAVEDEDLDSDAESDMLTDEPMDASCIHLDRLPCIVHTVQLVVIACTKSQTLQPLLKSARRVIEKIKRSSVAIQKLKAKAQKVVMLDCPTRWSSTYMMLARLLELKPHVTEV